jgi:methyl-accepting chemotaxis protein
MLNSDIGQVKQHDLTEVIERRTALATSIARMSQPIMLVMAALMFLAWLMMREYTQLLIYAAMVGVMGVVSWAYLRFASMGQATTGGMIYLGWFLVLTFSCVILVPQALASAALVYIFAVLLANFMVHRRSYAFYLAACLVGFVLDVLYVFGAQRYWFPDLPYNIGPMVGALNGVVALLVVSLYMRMIIRNQEALYVTTNEAKREIEQRAAQEQARRSLIQQTVNDYVDMMTSVSKGNLNARIPIDEQDLQSDDDPLVKLGMQINQTIASLETMLLQIGEAANRLSAASAEILASVTQQVSGSVEQSSAITQTSTTVQEVRAIAEQSVERAQEVVAAARQAAEVSRRGQTAVQETIQSMNRIRERVETISLNILELSEQTQRIGEIIDSVSQLASQSNLLALNAAVEAAHAGERGKGFSVVAAEVRSLAEQSKMATVQVKDILQEIQKATNTSVMTTEEGIKVVEQSASLAQRTQETIEQLAGVIADSVQRMMQVQAGGSQQATGIEQVSLAMQNIQTVSVQSLASTRQAEQSAQDLTQLASQLNQTLARYDRSGSNGTVDFPLARLHHKNWLKRLGSYMEGHLHLTVDGVASHKECDLGKWLYGTALNRYASSAEIRELEQVHEAFHSGLKQVVRLNESGQQASAQRELLAVQRTSERIFRLLETAERQVELTHSPK